MGWTISTQPRCNDIERIYRELVHARRELWTPRVCFLFFVCFIVLSEGEGRFFCSFLLSLTYPVDLLHARLDLQLADPGPLLEGSIDLNVTADQVIVPSVRAFFPIVKLTHFPLRTTS